MANYRNMPKKYDVFISFRGEDTRQTFTSLLYHALKKENIESYIDYELKKGDEVGPSLVEAIQDSHISVVVFSENYASSTWCLEELRQILECRKRHGQVVMPVFYNIDPSHVRHQTESYDKAFVKHERALGKNQSFREKIPAWKAALKEAANISGWDSSTFRDVSEFIENIVRDVWQKLSLMYPKELKDVQIDENFDHVESLLKRISRVGIWGMGGLGKTTIARHMFAKHFAQYDSLCFLENVREESEKLGLTYVRNKLLGELLKRKITESDALGTTFIERRLSGRKIFVVLDDVRDDVQLEYLCAELGNFRPNSRLIVTTRNRHTLRGRVDEIHEVTKWESKESLKLFCLGAFKQSHPQVGYERLSERAIAYAGGVPLALKVLGTHLHSRDPQFWESELNHLENNGGSLDEVQQVLQVSYNHGLSEREKKIFLDIAFFFKDENKDFATGILDACGFSATSGIVILQDKALITISKDNRIQMHDLLQQMALDIVRIDRGKRSRLRDIEEVRDVLKNNKGADAVEGIIFDLSQKVNLHVRADTFNMMIDLRFLRLYVPLGKERSSIIYPPEVIMPFSDKLRYLEWNGYPFKSLPQPFCAELLVEICLPHSDVEHLWHGMQELVNLEGIDLSECKQLVKLPDLSRASKLKWLYLSGCESLCEIQPSIFSKDTLVTLLLIGCKKLQSLMGETQLRSLEKVDVCGCSSLEEFSLSSDSIESLDLSNTGIKILHSSIGGMSKLVWLSLAGLSLANLPKELSCLRSLTELRLSNCNIVTKLKLEAVFDGLGSLKTLYLNDCGNLLELPANISSLSLLYELRLDGSSVERLPISIKYLSKLEILCLDNCKCLRSLPELPPNIKEFHADNCISLVTVSTLKTFSETMKGTDKYISFKNGTMMKSNGSSFHRIIEDVILTMKSAALHNILVRKKSLDADDHNDNIVKVCLPGSRVPRQFKYRSRVPRQFKYRTTHFSSVTIAPVDLYISLGFILLVVVSPANGMEEHRGGAVIRCQCYTEDGRKVGHVSTWHHKTITDLNMDHVFVWYDPYHFDSILYYYKTRFSFEFCVTSDVVVGCDGFFSIKECGVFPISYSEIPRLLSTINVDPHIIEDLREAIQLESQSIGICDDWDDWEDSGIRTQTQNQELDLNEQYVEWEGHGTESIESCDDEEELDSNGKCHCSYDCLIGPLRHWWRLISTCKGVTDSQQ